MSGSHENRWIWLLLLIVNTGGVALASWLQAAWGVVFFSVIWGICLFVVFGYLAGWEKAS